MPLKLWTIGYGGLETHTLIRLLHDAGVSTVVDVRWMPLSRKRGFSKTALAARLMDADLSYVHVKELGAPKPLRVALSAAKDFSAFARSYRIHLREQVEALEDLTELVRAESVCVLCLETDPEACHRGLLAEHLQSEVGVEVVHL